MIQTSIRTLKREILKYIEQNENRWDRGRVSTFELLIFLRNDGKINGEPNKLYKAYNASLELLILEGFLQNYGQKPISDTEVMLTSKGREWLQHKGYKEYLSNPWVIGLGVTVLGGLIVVYLTGFFGLASFQNAPSFPISSVETDEVPQLSIGLNFSRLREVLGEPLTQTTQMGLSTEYFYISGNALIQVVVNDVDEVISFSASVLDGMKKVSDYGKSVILGETSLAEYGSKPKRCFGFVGANGPKYYFEEFYFGRPGQYLYYYVGSYNDSLDLVELPSIQTYQEDDSKRYRLLQEYDCNHLSGPKRDTFVIKTMMYSSVPLEQLSFLPGISSDRLRLLKVL